MQQIICPECGAGSFAALFPRPDGKSEAVVPIHTTAWFYPGHRDEDLCLVAGLWLSEAEGVAAIRREGGDRLRLAAHP